MKSYYYELHWGKTILTATGQSLDLIVVKIILPYPCPTGGLETRVVGQQVGCFCFTLRDLRKLASRRGREAHLRPGKQDPGSRSPWRKHGGLFDSVRYMKQQTAPTTTLCLSEPQTTCFPTRKQRPYLAATRTPPRSNTPTTFNIVPQIILLIKVPKTLTRAI